MAIRAKFTGDGLTFHAGIPATDMTEEEYQALDVEQRKVVRESPLYDTKTDAEMRGSHDSPSAKAKASGKASKPAAPPSPDPTPEPDPVATPEPAPFAAWAPIPTPPVDEGAEDVAF